MLNLGTCDTVSFNDIEKLKKIDNMCRKRQLIGYQNKYIILETLYKLQKAKPKQMEDYLIYKNGGKSPISRCTIFRILKELQEEIVVKSVKGYYFIYHDEFKYIKDSPISFCKYFLGAIKNLH